MLLFIFCNVFSGLILGANIRRISYSTKKNVSTAVDRIKKMLMTLNES